MLLYHYSVDSYQGGKILINDYAKHYLFAEPFLLALEKGRDVFDATFYSTMYLSRELCSLKLRKLENYQKDAVEGIFEFVRRQHYLASSVSRLQCVYYCKTLSEAVQYAMDDCIASGDYQKEQVKILEVEVEDARVYTYDQTYFNRAMDAINNSAVDEVFSLAISYFAKEMTEHPLPEIISDGKNEILREITY